MSSAPEVSRRTAPEVRAFKKRGERVVVLTAYDAPHARLADDAGIDVLLVGDSVATTVLGMQSTIEVGMSEMLHHCRAVIRGSSRAHVVMDLPFLSYQASADDAVYNAGRALKEGGAQSVKLEGGARLVPLIERLVDSGIPVMGHVGLKPQSVNQTGGYGTQGRDVETAQAIIDDALAIAGAGAYAIVLEKVPAELAAHVTSRVAVPTIGIGSGAGCDGQVLVLHDMLGLDERVHYRHTKEYATLAMPIRQAMAAYANDVRSGAFPAAAHAVAGSDTLRAYLEGLQ